MLHRPPASGSLGVVGVPSAHRSSGQFLEDDKVHHCRTLPSCSRFVHLHCRFGSCHYAPWQLRGPLLLHAGVTGPSCHRGLESFVCCKGLFGGRNKAPVRRKTQRRWFTSLICILLSTRGCSSWRPTAVMSTIWRETYSLPRIFLST